jgi:hypothetical protein
MRFHKHPSPMYKYMRTDSQDVTSATRIVCAHRTYTPATDGRNALKSDFSSHSKTADYNKTNRYQNGYGELFS